MLKIKTSNQHVFDAIVVTTPRYKIPILCLCPLFILTLLMSNPAVVKQDLRDASQVTKE
jgi:hypothetical protein